MDAIEMFRKSFEGKDESAARALVLMLADMCVHEAYKRNPSGNFEREDVRRVYKHWVDTFCEKAVSIVFKHSESPIERYFLGSLIISGLFVDPAGFRFTGPSSDVLRDIAHMRKRLEAFNDERLGAVRKTKVLYDAIVDRDDKDFYLSMVGMDMQSCVHVTPQATFKKVGNDGETFRVDALCWIPNNPDVMVAVECDGYEWHSDREAFTSDRSRDRTLKSIGVDVMRFSGREIFANPASATAELVDFIGKRLRVEGEASE